MTLSDTAGLDSRGLQVCARGFRKCPIGQIQQLMVRGLKRVDQMFVLNMATYNLVRMRTLGQARPHAAG